MKIPVRFTSSCSSLGGDPEYIKELHLDTSNGDYIWIVNGVILEQGCDPENSSNEEILEYYKEIIE